MVREVHSDAHNHTVPRTLKQDAGELCLSRKQVVGPFQHDAGRPYRHSIENRYCRDKSERRSRGIPFPQANNTRGMKIPDWGNPGPPRSSTPGGLAVSDQPVAIPRRRLGQHVGIGRSGFDNAPDRQNSDPAAAALLASSIGISA